MLACRELCRRFRDEPPPASFTPSTTSTESSVSPDLSEKSGGVEEAESLRERLSRMEAIAISGFVLSLSVAFGGNFFSVLRYPIKYNAEQTQIYFHCQTFHLKCVKLATL